MKARSVCWSLVPGPREGQLEDRKAEETIETLSFYDESLIYDIDASQSPLDVLRDIINRMSEIQRHRTTPRPSAVAEQAV